MEYAILTNEIYKEWSGMTANEYKNYKGICKEFLRYNMSDSEVALADLGEIATREIAQKQRLYGLEKNKKVAKNDIENNIGSLGVTKENSLNYQYIDETKQIENK